MDFDEFEKRQANAIVTCQQETPISVEEGRKMLAAFSFTATKHTEEARMVAARVAFDQNVRLQESNERLSWWVIALTVVLVFLTLALVFLGVVTYAKS